MSKSLSELIKKYEKCNYLMLSNSHSKKERESFYNTIFKVNNPVNLHVELINFIEILLGDFTFRDGGQYISFVSDGNINPSTLELYDYSSGVIEVN